MNELKEKLAAIGLSDEMADKAIETVASFVKSKIPQSYHSMIDDVLAGRPVRVPTTNPIGCNVKWDGKDAHWMPAEACDLV